ncbi:MAG TPA: hypothetical protein EYG53_01560, partial [Gammaproteobacteria bacterium]|nr:hypothetical protein [Gammaproteobacteria bacterium]
MIRILCLLMLSGLLGASGVAHALDAACAILDEDLNVKLPCVTDGTNTWSANLGAVQNSDGTLSGFDLNSYNLLSDYFSFNYGGQQPEIPKIYSRRYSNHILGGVRLNDVYANNFTQTTLFGPAYANVWLEQSNFLACLPPSGRKISYALCYYSGPDQPTGNDPDNPSLPCELSPDGIVANCTCYEISTELLSPKIPYYVDIHAISNLDIYNKTVEACGEDGLKCALGEIVPPVCDAINTNLLVPGADAISVFSPIFIENYLSPTEIVADNTSTSCESGDAALYAGCMTAPCYTTGKKDAQGRDLMECKCPVHNGPFQIGQPNQNCDANGSSTEVASKTERNTRHIYSKNVWSAAYNPNGGPITIPDGACAPDLPGEHGCDLYDSGKDYAKIINPDGALCSKVCDSYGGSAEVPENQVGYTCDATLCTTL